ncbi:hypothetical protein BJ165DRAFT_24111 [Panaeolus papilionaceus]|nr:hypothetical protein BJ165DRAFT_24111 [Panaeolus papilionaceus]
MTKPTLVQSILNKPSQTYSQPTSQKKDYYSNRQEMLRIAAEANVGASSASAPSSSSTSVVSTTLRQSSTKSPGSSSVSLDTQTSKSNVRPFGLFLCSLLPRTNSLFQHLSRILIAYAFSECRVFSIDVGNAEI